MQLKHYIEPLEITSSTSCENTAFPKPTELLLPPECDAANEFCSITQDQALALEQSTTNQADCAAWREARKKRVTASVFAKVTKRKRKVTKTFLKNLFDPKQFSNEATRYGRDHEGPAKRRYLENRPNYHLHECGLVVNPKFSFLGATPDGKICTETETAILEVKCPYVVRKMTINEAIESPKDFCLHFGSDGKPALKKHHEYYDQIQGQLMITGAPFVDFVVYTLSDIHIERVQPDKDLHKEMLYKLATFYKNHAISYLS